MTTSSVGLEAASERLADHFTRPMRAATSKLGMLTDPAVVCAGIAVAMLGSVILYNLDIIDQGSLVVAYVGIAVPVVVALVINVALRGARTGVVTWLAALPFPIDNINALLNGVGQHVVVRFGEAPPSREELTDALDGVHGDCFALDFHEAEPEVELVIGVADSKVNPTAASFRKFVRVRRMIDECLVPISKAHPIVWARVS